VRELLERLELSEQERSRLQHQLAALKRVQFGRKSEQVSPDQLALWVEGLEESRTPAPAGTVDTEPPAPRERPAPDGLLLHHESRAPPGRRVRGARAGALAA
jgi:hypothetical protein